MGLPIVANSVAQEAHLSVQEKRACICYLCPVCCLSRGLPVLWRKRAWLSWAKLQRRPTDGSDC